VETKGLMGGLYRITEWIMRLVVINLLWIAFSIPFIFIAFPSWINFGDVLSVKVSPELLLFKIVTGLIPVTIVTPLTFIPATSAAYSVARKWVMGEDDVPLFKTFIRSYRQNYKQSMLGGFIFAIIGLILFIDGYFFAVKSQTFGYLFYLFLLLFILLAAAFVNFLSILAHFEMKTTQMIKNSFMLTLGNPFRSIGNLISIAIVVAISSKYTFLIVFFMGSTIAFVTFWQFHQGLIKIQEKIDKLKSDKT